MTRVFTPSGEPVPLEVETEYDRSFSLPGGEAQWFVRVKYRPEGSRRWTRFLLVADTPDDLPDLDARAAEAAQLHYEGKAINVRL